MGKWIPVSKELPTEDTEVIVCDIDGVRWIGKYHGPYKYGEGLNWSYRFGHEMLGKIAAWMPMPEGYTGEENPEEQEQPEECRERLLQEWLKDESEKNTAWLDAHNFGDCQIEYSMRLGREEVLGKVMSLLGIE